MHLTCTKCGNDITPVKLHIAAYFSNFLSKKHAEKQPKSNKRVKPQYYGEALMRDDIIQRLEQEERQKQEKEAAKERAKREREERKKESQQAKKKRKTRKGTGKHSHLLNSKSHDQCSILPEQNEREETETVMAGNGEAHQHMIHPSFQAEPPPPSFLGY
jgi:hypothetical protein